jgi:hypothetical protein
MLALCTRDLLRLASHNRTLGDARHESPASPQNLHLATTHQIRIGEPAIETVPDSRFLHQLFVYPEAFIHLGSPRGCTRARCRVSRGNTANQEKNG